MALDETAQTEAGTMSWITITGTGGHLAVNTCFVEGISGDAYTEVYTGDCDNQEYVTFSSGYGSDCSVAYFESPKPTQSTILL